MSVNPYISPDLVYTLPDNLTRAQLASHARFQRWLSMISRSLALQAEPDHPYHRNPYTLHEVNVLYAQYWRGKPAFLLVDADIRSSHGRHGEASVGEKLGGIAFIKGGSVGMLVILQVESTGSEPGPNIKDGDGQRDTHLEEYIIFTVQPRYAVGSLTFVEIPSGMVEDDEADFSATAAREMEEECGIAIEPEKWLNLTDLAILKGHGGRAEQHLTNGVFSMPGASDEFTAILMARKKLSPREMADLNGRHTGLVEEGERIMLRIVKLSDAYKEGVRDCKTLSALALYHGLKGDGLI